MRLPNGNLAVVDDAKLVDYCLSTSHARGKHKARLFAAATGITATEASILRGALLAAADEADATLTRQTEFGDHYEVRFDLTGPRGTAEVLSVWLVATDNELPRLVTCYPI